MALSIFSLISPRDVQMEVLSHWHITLGLSVAVWVRKTNQGVRGLWIKITARAVNEIT